VHFQLNEAATAITRSWRGYKSRQRVLALKASLQHRSMLDRPPADHPYDDPYANDPYSEDPYDEDPYGENPYGEEEDDPYADGPGGNGPGGNRPGGRRRGSGGARPGSGREGQGGRYGGGGDGGQPDGQPGAAGGEAGSRTRKPKFSLQKPYQGSSADSKAAERRQAGPEPFTPAINPKSQKLQRNEKVEDRFERLERERKEKIEARRREKVQKEMDERAPKEMNAKSKRLTQRLGSVEDRLMDYQRQAKANFEKARQESEDREDATLTFHPKITRTAQQLERGPAVWEQWYKDKYKRLKELERAVRSQDLQDVRDPEISKGTARLAAKRPDADKEVYERLYAYQDKYRDNRAAAIKQEEERFSQTAARPQSAASQRARRAAEKRRAAAYEDYAETPSQLFSTVAAAQQERQPFTPSVNERSTQIVREKQERALQMMEGPDSYRSTGSTPRVYGAEVAPRVNDRRHQKSKQEWNQMVNSFKQDFES